MIWIRADANQKIGMGHVMRCLSVAAALGRMGEKVCFLTVDESTVPLLREKGQEYRILDSGGAGQKRELACLEGMLRQEAPRFFLADSYLMTAEYFRRVREYAPTGYVDDKCLQGLPLDVLINYNIFAEAEMYKEYEGTRLLLGTAYAPLREEFAGRGGRMQEEFAGQGGRMQEEFAGRGGRTGKKPAAEDGVAGGEPAGRVGGAGKESAGEIGRTPDSPLRVLVTTGGSDRYNLSGRFLERALARGETAKLDYCVVSGAYNANLDRLLALGAAYPNVHVHSGVKNMAELMEQSDIAVTAGGSTMYELSAMGVPMICFSFVDNQERIVRGFVEKGLVCFGGDYLAQGDGMLEEAAEKLALLASDAGLRRAYAEKQRRVVDGRGAARIAQVLAGF